MLKPHRCLHRGGHDIQHSGGITRVPARRRPDALKSGAMDCHVSKCPDLPRTIAATVRLPGRDLFFA
ncbi:hypothetical protein B5G54_22000 [Ralstonia solanacearum]|nr:hypothetical protein KR98_23010 [Ralstonia solanacearum]OCQ65027.1 hypothetical protein AR465_10270 [Ralstonia solanacearum]OCQ73195.1 hypothetical protein AR464_00690 [Ralstonia solanacearum]OPK46010.1 hypothetical protein B5G54_22000 [Ralstonia solanacearum]OPK48002.1 hypothetical protein B5J95_23090 [Ralstonia solanacearum]